MWPHTQNQLFPENFWYVVALDQTNSKIQKLNPYLQFSRGFRIFREIGVLGSKKSKIFFCLKMAGNGQKQRALTFFDVFWVICCFLVFWKFLIFHDDLHSRVMNEVIYLRNQFWSSLLLAELYNNQFQSRNKTFFSMNSQL